MNDVKYIIVGHDDMEKKKSVVESDVYPYLMSTGRKEKEEETCRAVDSIKLIARGKKLYRKIE